MAAAIGDAKVHIFVTEKYPTDQSNIHAKEKGPSRSVRNRSAMTIEHMDIYSLSSTNRLVMKRGLGSLIGDEEFVLVVLDELIRDEDNILVLSLISALLTCCEAHNSLSTFDVLDYGAVGDGCTDDTIAFVETWKSTCNAETEIAAMLVPDGNTFLVHPMAFDGPCKPTTISFMISGIIIAPDSPEAWKGRNQGRWLVFKDVDGLSVDGTGMIDGRGKGWWDILCAKHGHLPVLSFLQCNKVSLSNILVVDSPQTHILIKGKSGNEVKVDNINVIRVRFNKTTNGVRIKTWQVGRGYVRGVLYEDINFMDVKNPIIIDQYYCNVRDKNTGHLNLSLFMLKKTGVQISDVRYAGIFGTSKSKIAIDLNCSQAVPCTDILLDTILLAPSTPGKKVISSCNNAYGSSRNCGTRVLFLGIILKIDNFLNASL
ncbi:hypothetical protein Acr_16g0007070 [Actinidia rufa]|uniref:Pectin lyase-like superfamily protein n=1 Tax=Actinidia rufa TaxID=165716 RepID=A0A7J0FZH2_9ERIC|nr:hypothetical protein Acr_16g0007070 [Actinidia rufa]